MIGKKIKERREELGLSQEQLAKLLGISKSAVSNYEVNISSPKETILLKLFEALKCDANYLYEDYLVAEKDFTVNTYEKKHIRKYRTLDEYGKEAVDSILNIEYKRCTYIEEEETATIELPYSLLKASAGLGDYLFDEDFETIEVEDTPLARKATFVIEVDGDSMLPDYENGDKVFVKGQQDINVGEIGIFIVNGNGYIKKKGNGELISLNSDYPNVKFNEFSEIKCVGKVLGKVEFVAPRADTK